MKPYADAPVRMFLQIAADLLALAWVYLWIRAALSLREIIMGLNRPGELMVSTGEGFSEHMDNAAEQALKVPLAGDALATPFTSMSGTGESLSAAGASFQESVASLGLTLPLLTAALPLLLLAATWLPARARWIRQAGSVRRLRGLTPEARSRLLALRALASVSPSRLAGVHEDPAGAWHADDRKAVRALASLELRRLGLRGF
ncbi:MULTISPECIES: hypothetical protein [Nocardiopsis]|uniref:Transmembrane protein n=1 Tax=Nocardiopsis sinuspersici TaxID=501010 RepID=A0A1V3C372_9ACTN|nr:MULTISPECIES: hypothetical protein [Nocardiopsis]NYH51512.1 hypothetical protein [Nocardiopsis sinuspersici]OOC55143.1 hypothetical protein NOSIN_16125 [Nocardiopsis sinuspersici]